MTSLSAVGSMLSGIGALLAAVVALFLPTFQRWFYRPNIKLGLNAPAEDNKNLYWHIEVKNLGCKAQNAAVFVTHVKSGDSADFKAIPKIKLEWPYESAGLQPFKPIQNHEFCDFFSTENDGKLHTNPPTTLLSHLVGKQPLSVRLKLIADDYESEPIEIKINRDSRSWTLTQV